MAKDTFFYSKKTLNCGGRVLDLSIPAIMGIINVTPDSFFTESRQDISGIVKKAQKMLQDGAAILDIGGYSTRPGAEEVSVEEEEKRVIPAIKEIIEHFPDAIISIDTFRSRIAEKAVGAGASMINDISGGTLDKEMFSVAGSLQVPYVLMHMRGNPQNMASLNNYEDLMKELLEYFYKKTDILHACGVKDIIIDPGIGFAKSFDQNYEILQKIGYFKALDLPLLIGLSRKSFIYKKLGNNPEDALNGSTVLHTIAMMNGASILRVHDVKEAADAAKLYKLVYP